MEQLIGKNFTDGRGEGETDAGSNTIRVSNPDQIVKGKPVIMPTHQSVMARVKM